MIPDSNPLMEQNMPVMPELWLMGSLPRLLVIAMGKAGMMGVFGAGGLMPDRIEKAIQTIQQALP